MPAPLVAEALRRGANYAARKAKQRAKEKVARTATESLGVHGMGAKLIVVLLAVMLMPVVGILASLGFVGRPTEAEAKGSCASGQSVPTSADVPQPVAQAINALKSDYELAGAETGVAWSALAAIDLRENNNDPMRSALGGELGWPAKARDTGIVSANKRESLVQAANHFKGMARWVYGVEVNINTGGDDMQKAFIAYNRGQSYKLAGLEPSASPYVYNLFDGAHQNMVFPDIAGETLAGTTDTRLGAYTLFVRLGGSSASCGLSDDAIVRIAQEQLGLRETPDGCNCGEQIQKFLGSSPGELWCADFVSWVYREAGLPFTGGSDGGWRVINVGVMHQWHVTNGLWFSSDSAEDPRPGDVISFITDVYDGHVGLVERLDDAGTPGVPGDDTIHTIEGNTSNMVARRDYRRVGGSVVGWGRRK